MRSRREFLKMCGALSGAAYAQQPASDFKALVCVFLFGGNDGANMVVPMESAEYASYSTSRATLALRQSDLAAVQAQGRAYGFHGRLAPLKDLYLQKRMAVLANTGMLVRPVTRDELRARTAALPRNLYSHSDQTQQWQSSNPLGAAGTGWGGRALDTLRGSEVPLLPPAISVAGNSLFLAGQSTFPANLSGNNFGLEGVNESSRPEKARLDALQAILALDSGATLISASSGVLATGMKNAQEVRRVISGAAPIRSVFPNSGLGNQLKQIAQILSVRGELGASRQVYFCSMGGFDSHSDLIPSHDNRMLELGPALAAFYRATEDLGIASKVTTFTASEFGRTLNASSTNGSDHGWGSHHLILGGDVRGGEAYGRFPSYALSGPDDSSDRGTWIPTTSLDQYGATLARWFGVSNGDLGQVFPSLANFPEPNLGILG